MFRLSLAMVLFVWKHSQLAAIRVSHRLKKADEIQVNYNDFNDFISSVDGLYMKNDKVIFQGNATTQFNKGDFASVRQFLKGKKYAHWARMQERVEVNKERDQIYEKVEAMDFAVRFISSLGMALQSPEVSAQAHQMAFSTYIHSAMVQIVGQNLASLAKLVKTVKAVAPPEWSRFLQDQVTKACHARHKFSLLSGGCLRPSTPSMASDTKAVVISIAECLQDQSQGEENNADEDIICEEDGSVHKRMQLFSRLFDVQHQRIKGTQEEVELLQRQLKDDKDTHKQEMKKLKEMFLLSTGNIVESMRKILPELLLDAVNAKMDVLASRAVQSVCSGSAEQTILDMLKNPPLGINVEPIVSKATSGLSRAPTEDDLVADWIDDDKGKKKKGWKFDVADFNRRLGDNLETRSSAVAARLSTSGFALRSPTSARTAGATTNQPASSSQDAATFPREVA